MYIPVVYTGDISMSTSGNTYPSDLFKLKLLVYKILLCIITRPLFSVLHHNTSPIFPIFLNSN